MKSKVFLYPFFLLVLAAGCNKRTDKPPPEDEFCLCDSLTIPVINKYLAGISNDASDYYWSGNWPDDSNFEKRKLLKLELWLKSHTCLDYVKVGCYACNAGNPRRSRIIVKTGENDYLMEVAMGNPLEVVSCNPRLGCDCKEELYYYGRKDVNSYEISKIFLNDFLFRNDALLVGFFEQTQDDEILDYINQIGLFKTVDESNWILHANLISGREYHKICVETKEQKTCAQLKDIIRTLEKSPIVAFASLTFESGEPSPISVPYSSDVYTFDHTVDVKVKDKDYLSDLYAIMQETNSWIVIEYQGIFQGSFLLGTNKNSMGNSLQVANYFWESGKFSSTYPGLTFKKFYQK